MNDTTLVLKPRKADNSVIEKTSDLVHLAYYASSSNVYKVTKVTNGYKLINTVTKAQYLFTKHPTNNFHWSPKGIMGTDGKTHKAHLLTSKAMGWTLRWW